MQSKISFVLDGKIKTIDFKNNLKHTPTTTVLNYLRSLPNHKGVKEGCGEGDCGACTVVLTELSGGKIKYSAVNSCLIFLPKIHGKQLITVENIKLPDGKLHPVQQAMVDLNASQCGFCTPGIVMSLFALYKNRPRPSRAEIEDALTGNLCRCTGYKPIIDAAQKALKTPKNDHFSKQEKEIVKMLKSISKDSLYIETENQKYYLPVNLNELLNLRTRFPEALIINGATDAALRVTKGHELLKEIIDVSNIAELKEIKEERDSIYFAAGVTVNEVMQFSKKSFPALYQMGAVFGSKQIRNLATIGGNLGSASPIGDLLPVLTAYNAQVVLQSAKGKRLVDMDGFITGYRKTVLRKNEIIKGVRIPKINNGVLIKSYKVSKRKDMDISTVSAAFRLELNNNGLIDSIKIIYGGMAEMTKRAKSVEAFLKGKAWKRETVENAMPLFDKDFKPISDARSGAEFRSIAARNLLLKFWGDTN